jgi:hypothetical protein
MKIKRMINKSEETYSDVTYVSRLDYYTFKQELKKN